LCVLCGVRLELNEKIIALNIYLQDQPDGDALSMKSL
jgi:hypothetical protein